MPKRGLFSQRRSYHLAEQMGKLAEWMILLRYVLFGFWPVRWRYRTPFGEIDLIMKRASQIRFIEVKYRRKAPEGEVPISDHQWQRLARASHFAYHQLSPDQQHKTQFDVAVVTGWGRWQIYENHIL